MRPEFKDTVTVKGSFEDFCQPGYVPKFGKKTEQCAFCHSRYNPKNLRRKRGHESAACKEK